jgi:diguanylate cyclase (GGDEF)-like protein
MEGAPSEKGSSGQDPRPLEAAARAGGAVVFSDGSRVPSDELMRLSLFRRVGLEAVVGLLERCTLRGFEPGEAVLARGQSSQPMYLVLSGRLSVHVESPDAEPMGYVEPGQTIGELALLDHGPAPAFVRAAESTRLIVIRDEAFWGLIWASHDLAINMLMLLSQRLRASHSAVAEGARQRRQLQRDAFTDALTGCHNRRWLDERLPRLVQRHVRANAPVSLLLVDVDELGRWNELHGHVAGDCLLACVARAMSASLRPTDLVARVGGEEFAVVLPGTPLPGAAVAAERVRQRVTRTGVVAPDDRLLPPATISIGVSTMASNDSAASLLARAAQALDRAKRAGRNRAELEEPYSS